MDIKEISKQIHDNARAKGFWDYERNFGEILMLIVSEVSEAMEADRKGRYADWRDEQPPIIHAQQLDDEMYKEVFERAVKNTIEDELADTVIRILDLAYSRGIDLEWHIVAKMRYNSLREHMHGKKY
jgi:NTP pyrophosphatase (non-canonical NTP hydrolase)